VLNNPAKVADRRGNGRQGQPNYYAASRSLYGPPVITQIDPTLLS
jgi:hypothetical protein